MPAVKRSRTSRTPAQVKRELKEACEEIELLEDDLRSAKIRANVLQDELDELAKSGTKDNEKPVFLKPYEVLGDFGEIRCFCGEVLSCEMAMPPTRLMSAEHELSQASYGTACSPVALDDYPGCGRDLRDMHRELTEQISDAEMTDTLTPETILAGGAHRGRR